MSLLKEKFIVVPSVSQEELLRSLAKNGKNSFATRVVSPYQLALIALERAGIANEKEIIAPGNEAFIVFNTIKVNRYFKNITLIDLCDSFNSLNELRYNILSNEKEELDKLLNGEFKEKNKAIIEFYDQYIRALNKMNLIDYVQIIRNALSLNNVLDAEFELYEEFPLKPLELELVKKLSNNNFNIKKNSNEVSITKYVKSYGIKAEVEYVINEIVKNNIPFDNVEIVLPDETTYSKFIEDYFSIYHIPYTTGIKSSLLTSNAGRVYSMILDWQHDYSSKSSLALLINDYAFNKQKLKDDIGYDENNFTNMVKAHKDPFEEFIKASGQLRLTFNGTINLSKVDKCIKLIESKINAGVDNAENLELYKVVKNFILELNKGIVNFVAKYTNKHDEKVDNSVIETLSDIYKLAQKSEINDDYEIEKVALRIVCGSYMSSEGQVYVTTINKALAVYRPYLFVLGLSSNVFPGTPKEDSLILDSDFELFEIKSYSKKIINDKKEAFHNLISIASTNKAKIYLTYSYYNEQTLKAQNMSSVIFEVYKKENGESLTLKTLQDKFGNDDKYQSIKLFDFDLTYNKKVLNSYTEKSSEENVIIKKYFKTNEIEEVEPIKHSMASLLNKNVSASALIDFTKCPLMFLVKDYLYVTDEFKSSELDIIPDNDLGTLIHETLETWDNYHNFEEYLQRAYELLDEYLIFHVPVNENKVKNFKEIDMLPVLRHAYNLYDKDAKTVVAEQDLYVTHDKSGIKIHGLPDRVIELKDGTLEVVDYKVKRSFSHNPKEPISCVQVLLYAYLIEKTTGKKVSKGAFYYIRQEKTIEMDIDEYMYVLDDALMALRKAIDENNFPAQPSGDAKHRPCKFCPIKDKCKEGKK